MNKPIVAFLYDFDKTLCTRDMQEYTFIPSIGMEPNDFWHLANGLAEQEHMDSVLAYMYCMLTRTTLRRDHLVECGHDVVYNPGVEDWFDRINAYGDALGVKVEHYVLSSGLKEIIEGTSIADRFTKIFASEFLYDDKGVAL
ncbi:MAG: haloacid dehalogenase-like hydrolase [Clostridia bacterium]|nr:haloacid dehalogenase-like hydrolase [Clostridia bacterium]